MVYLGDKWTIYLVDMRRVNMDRITVTFKLKGMPEQHVKIEAEPTQVIKNTWKKQVESSTGLNLNGAKLRYLGKEMDESQTFQEQMVQH